jgi:16S rRNA (guanine966-N2)-methyltransferase
MRPKSSQKTDIRTPVGLRIIGGKYRGRKLHYSGDMATRPMKDRVRESVFNLLGPAIRGKHAFDLFAGTGALGLEAISRGAARATLVERHFPTADLIRKNVEAVGVTEPCEVVAADTFVWFSRVGDTAGRSEEAPWVVFISPPFDFYVDRTPDMLALIEMAMRHSPPGSTLAVECDARFDLTQLPDTSAWDVRHYPPAVIAIWRAVG